MSVDITRRTLLAAGATGAGAVVLAACGGSSGSDGSASTDAAAATTSAAGSSAVAAASSAAGSSATTADGLVALSTVPVGGAVSVSLPGDNPGIVARPTSATAVCFSAICTHQGCTVKPAGKTLNCPCHGSTYDALTGKVLSGPAPSPLPSVAVTVDKGQVVTAD